MTPSEEPPLQDLTQLDVEQLLTEGSTNLAAHLQRLVASLDDPNGVISAFESFASD